MPVSHECLQHTPGKSGDECGRRLPAVISVVRGLLRLSRSLIAALPSLFLAVVPSCTTRVSVAVMTYIVVVSLTEMLSLLFTHATFVVLAHFVSALAVGAIPVAVGVAEMLS